MKYEHRTASLLLLATLLTAGASDAVSTTGTNEFYGAYQNSIPIEVPRFVGIAPSLELNYDSSRGNGFAGVGWALSGFSVIERTSLSRGLPAFDSTDSFVLDGNELVADDSLGGTHSTKIQTYVRITRNSDTPGTTWTVTRKDGTTSVYRPVYTVSTPIAHNNVFRWGLSSVTDTSGNTVHYEWWCDPNADCYPSRVSYGQTTITLYREPRPDTITLANGRFVGRTKYRLKTIDIEVAGTAARAYQLRYETAPSSRRSRLVSVQQYGHDRVLDHDGAVTAGSRLPPITARYNDTGFGFQAPDNWNSAQLLGDKVHAYPAYSDKNGTHTMLIDMNGDGLSDYVSYYNHHKRERGLWVLINNGAGFNPPVNWQTAEALGHPVHGSPVRGSRNHTELIDMNADGLPDFVSYYNHHAKQPGLWVLINNGTGFDTPQNWRTAQLLGKTEQGRPSWKGQYTDLVDMNGDARPDFVAHYNYHAQEFGLWVLLNNGSGFDNPVNWRTADMLGDKVHSYPAYRNDNGTHTMLIDMNGDGLSDYVSYYNHHEDERGLWVLINNGAGFHPPVNWQTAEALGHAVHGSPIRADRNHTALIDMNGDGIPDLVSYYNHHTRQPGLWVLINNGSGFETPQNWRTAQLLGKTEQGRPSWKGQYTDLVDMNSDGRPDFVAHYNYHEREFGLWVLINNGSGFEDPVNWRSANMLGHKVHSYTPYFAEHGQYTRIVDINGDDLPDYVSWYNHKQQERGMWVLINTGRKPDLLTELTNGHGGTTAIEYGHSSAWPNTNNPPIVSVVTAINEHDGRGNVSTTRHAYAGGLYDRAQRRFLGFHKTTQIKPCLTQESACPYVVTEWEQDYGSLSKPRRIEQFDGAGRQLSSLTNTYTTNGNNVPYTSNQTEEWTRVFDSADPSQMRRSAVTRTFDKYGNVTQEITWGDYDVPGDETLIHYMYRPNTESYIVGKAAAISVYSGSTKQGTLLNQTLTYYDDNTTWDAMPTRGKATQGAIWLDSTNSYAQTRSTYDSRGNVTSETDALGNTTTHVIDPTGQFVIATTNPLGHTQKTLWDSRCGVRIQVTDANGGVSTRQFDPLCRLVRTDLPDGAWESRIYNDFVDAFNTASVEVRTPSADGQEDQWVRTHHDGLGRTWRVESKGPTAEQTIRTQTEYDPRGNVHRSSTPFYASSACVEGEACVNTAQPQWITAQYDAFDRVVALSQPDGSTTQTSYGLAQTTYTDENGNTRQETRDVRGNVLERVESDGTRELVTSYSYDAIGNLTTVVDPAGNVSSFRYNSLRKRIESHDPNLGTWHYEYDPGGRLSAQTDAKGQRTTFAYDATNRRTSKTTLANTSKRNVTTWTYDEVRDGYDNVGRLTTMIDSQGSQTYNYDQAGRIVRSTRIIDDISYTFTKRYDLAGRLKWTQYPDGDTVGSESAPLQYDGAGRLAKIPGIVTNARYDAAGRLTRQENANGTVTQRTFSNERGWLTSVKTVGLETIQDLSYERDVLGQVTHIRSSFPSETWSYAYDGFQRLVRATSPTTPSASETFTYSADGNLTKRTTLGAFDYGPTGGERPHAVRTAGGSDYQYDANGNMVSGAGRTLTWDGDNRLVSVNRMRFAYDGDGTRIKKVAPTSTTIYLGDYEVTDGAATKYIYLAGALVAKQTPSDLQWIHVDHLGSTQAVTNTTGAVLFRKTYGAYGALLSEGDPSEARGYTGQRLDETGLIYLHARYYDPVLGRFISADPTVPTSAAVGLNRYAYAANNPTNFTDIDGLGLFKKLKKKFKKFAKRLKRLARKASRALSKVAAKLSTIPVVGGMLAMPFSYHSAILAGEWKQAARIGATMAVMYVAAVLSAGTATIAATTQFVMANAAIGFGSGFSVAAINGGSMKTALKAGAIGAAMAAGSAALSRATDALADLARQEDTPWNGQHKTGPDKYLGRARSSLSAEDLDKTTLLDSEGPLFTALDKIDAVSNTTAIEEAYVMNSVYKAFGTNQGAIDLIAQPVGKTFWGPIAVVNLAGTTGARSLMVGEMARVQASRRSARRRSPTTFMAAGSP